ncbi:MAG: mechanosensitive ion channel domain-containing protein, partial [Myxococcota bacterium]
ATVAVGYVAAVLVARRLLTRMILQTRLSNASKLRWRAQLRNATVVAVLLGLTLIWAEQLRTFAISIVAIAAAIAVSTKEISACLLGSLIRTSGRGFEIGDRVQIGEVRGDVIDIGPMTTSLLEVGVPASIHARTGRVVTLPNSVYLSTGVFNETMAHNFSLHVVRIPLRSEDPWKAASERLERLGRAACADYFDEGSKSMTRLAAERGVTPPRLEPSVYIEVPEPGRVDLLLRVLAPARDRDAVGQHIMGRFLAGEDEPTPSPSAVGTGS